MAHIKLITAAAVVGALALAAPAANAQSHQRGSSRGSAASSAPVAGSPRVVGQAVPRTGPPPHVLSSRPYYPAYYRPSFYRPYYYRPNLRIGLGFGYPYYYGYPYGYPYGYSYGYPYGYSDYGYYGYPVPPPGYIVAGRGYGGVRITEAPKDAEVFADGYYVGIVDDFDGVFQHLDLEPGPHRIEIRAQGYQPIAFDVRVEPGQTITYRAAMRR
jgi:hypothetical protein